MNWRNCGNHTFKIELCVWKLWKFTLSTEETKTLWRHSAGWNFEKPTQILYLLNPSLVSSGHETPWFFWDNNSWFYGRLALRPDIEISLAIRYSYQKCCFLCDILRILMSPSLVQQWWVPGPPGWLCTPGSPECFALHFSAWTFGTSMWE